MSGKTTNAVESIIAALAKLRRMDEKECIDRKVKILLVAETNNAVDNIARKLQKHNIIILRMGNSKMISSDLFDVTIEGQIQLSKISDENNKKTYYDEFGREFRDKKYKKFCKKIIEASEVICATVTGCGDILLQDISFDYLVMDESTLTLEHSTLIPISLGIAQLLLIGDPKQLSPILGQNIFT